MSDTARTQLSSFATRSLPIADAGLPTCLVVLGMHRSGTSALTRVLSLLGSALPKTLMPPIPDNNITGFWESAPLAALNDRLLAEVGSRWDDWRAFPAGMLPPDLRARYLAQLAALITEEFGAAPLAILKDPRICRLASFYMDVLKGMGIRPLFVIPLRNPLAVSASLGRRDGMSSGFAQLLWLRHVLDAEAITRASRRAVVSYEALLMDWPKAVHLIGVRLGLDWPRSLNEARPEIEAFLSTEHQHFAPSRWEVAGRDDVPEWVKGTYENMLRLEKDPDDELAVAELDRIRAEFDSVCASVGAAMMEEVAARERRFQGERQQLAAQATELRTLLGAREGDLAQARAATAERDERIGRDGRDLEIARDEGKTRDAEIKKLKAEVAARVGELDALRSESAAARAELSSRNAEIRRLRAEVEARAGEFDAARAEVSCRNAEIARLKAGAEVRARELAQELASRDARIKSLESAEAQLLMLRSSRFFRLRDIAIAGRPWWWKAPRIAQLVLLGHRPQVLPLLPLVPAEPVSSAAAFPQLPRPASAAPSSSPAARRPESAEFDADWYLAAYADVRTAGIDPYEHYVHHGRAEGRLPRLPDLSTVASGIDPARETVLIVNHEASRTGAPILGHNVLSQLRGRYNVIVLSLGPGPLVAASREVGAIAVTLPQTVRSRELGEELIKRLAACVRIKFAIVNSIESRCVLPALARRFIPTLTLAHEFAAYTRPAGAFREAALWSGQVVYSSALTRDNARTEYEDREGRSFAVIPQGRCRVPQLEAAGSGSRDTSADSIGKLLRPPGFPADGIVVVGAGVVQLRKGIDLFVECASGIRRQAPSLDCRFVWIGKGYDPSGDTSYSVYLADQLRRSGLEEHCVFADEVEDLSPVLAGADIFLLSSRLDPLPNVAIDAMSEGVPLVCFDKCTGIADHLREAGLDDECVAPYLDMQEMVAKVLALAQSKALREDIGRRLSQYAAAAFDIARYADRLEQLANGEVERAAQEARDLETIRASGLLRLDYAISPADHGLGPEEAARLYVRSWASGVGRRKPFPGFHPGIYRSHRSSLHPTADPLADYVRAGQPPGPWRLPVITPDDGPATGSHARLRLGLHVHAYYPELFPEILMRLSRNRARPDLLISVADRAAEREISRQVRGYAGKVADIRVVPNRGRDIGAFLTEFGAAVCDGYDIIGHLHTKRTPDIDDPAMGAAWYRFLLDNLLGSEHSMLDVILAHLAANGRLGMVFPDDPHVVGWSKNRTPIEDLARRMGIEALPNDIVFPIGTMFWARVASLRRLFDLGLSWDDYPDEPLPYDGSLLHGLERLLPLAVQASGMEIGVCHVPGTNR